MTKYKQFFFSAILLSIVSCSSTKHIMQSGNWRIILKQDSIIRNYALDFPESIMFSKDSIVLLDKATTILESQKSTYKVQSDSIQVVFNTIGKKWKSEIKGVGKMKRVNNNLVVGDYKFTEGQNKDLNMKITFTRMWCCSNHIPHHCDEDLTKSCSGIQ